MINKQQRSNIFNFLFSHSGYHSHLYVLYTTKQSNMQNI